MREVESSAVYADKKRLRLGGNRIDREHNAACAACDDGVVRAGDETIGEIDPTCIAIHIVATCTVHAGPLC